MVSEVLPRRYASPMLVARGGMGEVYRATDSVLNRPVAVKVLSERYAREPEVRARFQREAMTAARLSGTRHVITVFDVGEHDDRPLIVMEYLEGGSLHDRLQRGSVAADQALEWLAQTAHALDRAHAQGVVHRDVKPANLLLDRDENVHVSDFGIASAAGLDTLTLPGTVLGTAGYLSPEQARGEPASAASDRYALGAVAFELLTGRRPFESETAATEAFAHVNAPVPSAARLDPALPARVDEAFERALAKDPDDRPSTAAELVDELRDALRGAAPAPAGIDPRVPPRPPTVHHSRRRPYAAAVLAAAVLLAAALGLAAAFGIARDAGGSERTQAGESGEVAERPTGDGVALNDAGFARMQDGAYDAALPLLVRAVDVLRGTGLLTEAYARYNLAFTRFALGHCTGVLTPLERSEAIQGRRSEIDELRSEWNLRCAAPVDEDDGKGKDKGKERGRGNGNDNDDD
jgi:eukaryotic-like serine/threonine-protein kinase